MLHEIAQSNTAIIIYVATCLRHNTKTTLFRTLQAGSPRPEARPKRLCGSQALLRWCVSVTSPIRITDRLNHSESAIAIYRNSYAAHTPYWRNGSCYILELLCKSNYSFPRSGHRDIILELLCKSHYSFHVLVSHHEICSSNKFGC